MTNGPKPDSQIAASLSTGTGDAAQVPPEEPPPAPVSSPALPPAAGQPGSPDLEDWVQTRARGQHDWYDKHAVSARHLYLGIKVVQLVTGASIPVAAGLHAEPALTGSLGALIVVLEGVQQLFQFHNNWIRYRVTAAALGREINLFNARVGDYAGTDPVGLLASRTEDISSSEATTWAKAAQSPPAAGSTG